MELCLKGDMEWILGVVLDPENTIEILVKSSKSITKNVNKIPSKDGHISASHVFV